MSIIWDTHKKTSESKYSSALMVVVIGFEINI